MSGISAERPRAMAWKPDMRDKARIRRQFMPRNQCKLFCIAFLVLAFQSCVPYLSSTGRTDADPAGGQVTQSGRYIVLFSSEVVPSDFTDRVARLGGTVENSLVEIGVAVVTGLSEEAAVALGGSPGVQSVEQDPIAHNKEEDHEITTGSAKSVETDEPASIDLVSGQPWQAPFYNRQWNMKAVHAEEAWKAGHLGSRDVVVAILDTGIDYLHPDLFGLVDLKRSKSFVPEEDVEDFYPGLGLKQFADLSWHGTLTASIIASNGKVLAGVNHDVTLLAVKVLDRTETRSASRLIAGIVYAANQGADVITARGIDIDKSENPVTAFAFELAAAYAFFKGAVIVALSFNDAADLDNNGDIVRYPCEAFNVICVSATGPTSADGNGNWENVDARATTPDPVTGIETPYSAFGSAIDVAAPGGSGPPVQNPPLLSRRVWVVCTQTPTDETDPPACRNTNVPILQRMSQVAGTSSAGPHVAGLAALLVAQLGHGKPALIRSRILESVDDLGDTGTDLYYGKGRINVARALGVIN